MFVESSSNLESPSELCVDQGGNAGITWSHELMERIPTPLPKLQLFVLLYVQLAEPITSTVILPFIVQLIDETGVTGGDISKVGYYAGLVQSLFFATEALMILQWGRLSDRLGRRPVILTGLFGLGLSMLCFGLSHTFWFVVASRALAGALNGNTGVIKCMMSEITDETNMARGFSFMPIVWAVGNTIGPFIGGSLQHPSERFEGVFQYSSFWTRNPYFLPCLTAALYSTTAFVLGFLSLNETAPAVTTSKSVLRQMKEYNASNYELLSINPTTKYMPLVPADKPPTTSLRTLLTRRVRIVILNYGLLAATDMSFVVLQPVFLSTPVANGGLGMTPSRTGVCLAAFGVASGAVSVIFFPSLVKRFGTRTVTIAGAAAHVGSYALFPVMNALARVDGRLGARVWIALTLQLALVTFPPMAFSCIFIFLTAAAPSRSVLGATTGLAQTTTSVMRAIGPSAATSLFALSIKLNLLGGTLVYVVMCTLAATTAAACTLLPATPWPRDGD